SEPNSDLDNWVGELYIGAERYQCSSDNLVLAGSELTRGHDIYGLVVATGCETKINLKKRRRSEKLGFLDARLNRVTLAMLGFLVLFISIGTIGHLNLNDTDDSSVVFQTILIYFLLFNGLIAQ